MSKHIGFPEGEAIKEQVAGRHKRGTYWRWIFQASTIVGILALTALLYNILNESFGFVAVQNQVDPEDMVQAMVEESVLALDTTTSSESDAEIAAGKAGKPARIVAKVNALVDEKVTEKLYEASKSGAVISTISS